MAHDTRTALLLAARDSLATHGYAGTSIRDLAAAVGIKESSVYKHFSNKQALLDAVVAQAEARLSEVAARFHVPFDDAPTAAAAYADIRPERLHELAASMLETWLHDPDVVAARRVLTLEQYRTPHAGELLAELTIERPLAFQATIFADLIARGLFRPADPAAVALAFWGPILAIMTSAEHTTGELPQQRLAAHLEHFTALHVVRQGGEA